jgi:hypothetical protein
MSHSDDVRAYVDAHYVKPARTRGQNEVEVLAGEVHRALGYSQRYPLVCSALGSLTFEKLARVRCIAVEGPLNGASTLFRFQVLG